MSQLPEAERNHMMKLIEEKQVAAPTCCGRAHPVC